MGAKVGNAWFSVEAGNPIARHKGLNNTLRDKKLIKISGFVRFLGSIGFPELLNAIDRQYRIKNV
jgi:hypothetical protein